MTVWCRNPDYNEMVLASAAIGWTLGRFAEGMDLYQVAVEKDPRLLDDKYLKVGEAYNTHSWAGRENRERGRHCLVWSDVVVLG